MLAIINYFRRLTSEAYDPLSILIEWVLIGLVVYAVLRFLAGTRGARLMKGIGLLLIVAFIVVRGLADRLHLERIQMLYQYFLAAAFLTALVAFQPELRRGLIRLGETPWFERWLRRPSGAIEPIVAAVKRLADQRIGALIAIEREVGLGGVIETGVRLDAKLTSELLETIFWPGSALHDMGLIVHGDRIVAASCQFPLADSEEVDRALGSRHRAAVGLSTESDAIVIVVSDETGAISLADQGHLRRGLSPEQLRELLRDRLGAGERARRAKSAPPAKAPARPPHGEENAHGHASKADRPDDRADRADLVLRGSGQHEDRTSRGRSQGGPE